MGERLSSKPQISQPGILPSPRLASARLSSPNTYSSSPLTGSLSPALTHQETMQGQPRQPWQRHTVWQLWSCSSQAKVQPCFPLQDSFWPFPPCPNHHRVPSWLQPGLCGLWPASSAALHLGSRSRKYIFLCVVRKLLQAYVMLVCCVPTNTGLSNAPRVGNQAMKTPATCIAHNKSRIHLLIELYNHREALKSSDFYTVNKNFSNLPALWQVSELSSLHCPTTSPS